MSGRVNILISVFSIVLVSSLSPGTPLHTASPCMWSIFILARRITLVWSLLQQQLCKWSMLWYFLDLISVWRVSFLRHRRMLFGISMSSREGSSPAMLCLTHTTLFFSRSCLLSDKAHGHDSPLRNSQSLLFCADINTRGEMLAGNVNLDQASKTQQNNWWSCGVWSFFNGTKP